MNYLYAPESFTAREKIYKELCKAIGNENRLAMFADIKGLSARLRSFNNPEIVTFLSVKLVDMPSITAIRELFRDAAFIILLSDGDQTAFDMSIRLNPKFVGMMKEDLDKIEPIVKKLVVKYQRNRSR